MSGASGDSRWDKICSSIGGDHRMRRSLIDGVFGRAGHWGHEFLGLGAGLGTRDGALVC